MNMLIDVHAHIFPEIQGLVAGGTTRGLGYGHVAVGDKEIQMMPPLNERTESTHEMLIANMDWAGVDKAVLLQLEKNLEIIRKFLRNNEISISN